jgi:4-amino-4-deoxy-L-arabinose transferase-like glycosyltransferase
MKRYLSFFSALGIFLLALAVRITYNVKTGMHYVPRPDSIFYTNIATNLVKSGCYCIYSTQQTVDRAPFWPGLLAILYFFTGPRTDYARLMLCFIGSGTCVLVFLFVKEIFGQGLGVLAGLFAAIYAQLYVYDGFLYSESVFIFLTLAFCYSLYHLYLRLKQGYTLRQNIWLNLLCALFLTATSLTRPNGLLYAALLLPWGIVLCLTRTLPWAQTFKQIILLIVVSLVLITPWTVRNYIVSKGSFIPIAVGDGTVLMGAYNSSILNPADTNDYQKWMPPHYVDGKVTNPYPEGNCAATCEVARENVYKQYAMHWIRTHMEKMPTLLEAHFLNLWLPDTHEADMPIDSYPNQAGKAVVQQQKSEPPVLFAFAFLGILLTLRKWREQLFFYLLFLSTIGEAVYFFGIPRFRAPLEPLLVFFAAGAIWAVLTFVRLCTRHFKKDPLSTSTQ